MPIKAFGDAAELCGRIELLRPSELKVGLELREALADGYSFRTLERRTVP